MLDLAFSLHFPQIPCAIDLCVDHACGCFCFAFGEGFDGAKAHGFGLQARIIFRIDSTEHRLLQTIADNGRAMPAHQHNIARAKRFCHAGAKRAVADVTYAFKAERMINDRPVSMINLPWMALRGDALKKEEAILAQLQALVLTTAGAFKANKDLLDSKE